MSDSGTGGRAEPELPIGAVFAGFRIEEVVGRGGMGIVYRARDLALDSERALKVLDPAVARDGGFRARFQRESRLAAAIEHPAVLPVHRAGEEAGRLYLAMRLVRGPDLERMVANDGPLDPQRAARLISAIAGALDAAHARGIVHRDVKPANMLVELGADGERVFLTDFGIGRPAAATAPITSTGELLGTVDYISPEQIAGDPATPRSDVYALGCVVCYLLTGEPPFRRTTDLATLYAHANAARPRPSVLEPGLPDAIDEVVVRATAVSPQERHETAGALAEDLAAALGGTGRPGAGGRAPRGSHEARTVALRTRRRRGILALAGLTLAGVAAAIVALTSGGDADPEPARGTAEFATVALVDAAPSSIVVGEVNVLVGAQADSRLYAIDPDTEELARDPDRVPRPSSVAVGFGSVWVASAADDSVVRFGPPERSVPDRIGVGDHPADIAIDESSVWVANKGDGTVTRVHPYARRARETVEVAGAPSALAAGDGFVWAASPDAGAVTRIDPRGPGRAPRTTRVRLGGRPEDVAATPGSVWVVDSERGTLTELSASAARPVGAPVGGWERPVAVASGPSNVWVADNAGDTITPVDAASGEPGAAEAVANDPVALAVGSGSVWVASAATGIVSRVTPG